MSTPPRWGLDPQTTFLNHGSFGACPIQVLEHQRQIRDQLESQPLRFFLRQYLPLLDQARHKLADFVGADSSDLVFVNNATQGVGAVVHAWPLKAGDHILVLNQGYGACTLAAKHAADRAGASLVTAHIPFPIQDPQQAIDAILDAVTPRTSLAIIDHITSATGLVLPIKDIVAQLKARGVETLVDGAHAPGMVPLDLDALGAAFYTGNCHKWICSPKGAALLHARADMQPILEPLTISHGFGLKHLTRPALHDHFDWPGTLDPSAWLSVPCAIDTMGAALPGGWPALRDHNHQLVLKARALLCDALNIAPPAPKSMIGSLAAVPLPDGQPFAVETFFSCDPLHDRLLDEHQIEVPIISWPSQPSRLLRVSAQLYNSLPQYQTLADALPAALTGA